MKNKIIIGGSVGLGILVATVIVLVVLKKKKNSTNEMTGVYDDTNQTGQTQSKYDLSFLSDGLKGSIEEEASWAFAKGKTLTSTELAKNAGSREVWALATSAWDKHTYGLITKEQFNQIKAAYTEDRTLFNVHMFI